MKRKRSPVEFCARCGKIAWDTKDKAKAHIQRLRSSTKGRQTEKLSVYKCPHHAGWHIGHDKKDLKAPRKEV